MAAGFGREATALLALATLVPVPVLVDGSAKRIRNDVARMRP